MRAILPMLIGAALPLAAPGTGMDDLTRFAGRWDCAGRFVRSGRPIASTIAIRPANAPETLILEHDDRPPNAYHATELWSLTAAGGRAAIADASGMRWFDLTVHDGTLSLDRSDASGPLERFTYRIAGGRMAVEWLHRDAAGALVTGDTLACAPAPSVSI